jgi:hypothetical protein
MNVAAARPSPPTAPVPRAVVTPARPTPPKDADGDHDGTRAAAPAKPRTVVSQGKVDTYA